MASAFPSIAAVARHSSVPPPTASSCRSERFRPPGDATATEACYSTAFHEVGHATDHANRFDRNLRSRFGDASCAAEGLVAELCSVFVIAELGLAHKPKENAKEYLAHWLGILRADGKALMTAAATGSAAPQPSSSSPARPLRNSEQRSCR